ncbi:MBL fold metallo-hydrolase [Catenovulum sp. 2E275]|uniref:MBL fold metallo-hydrolase n=1 Tax=Catenovulum sp. 2E275 TaxID=2980497 RepID=UPI0021D08164|nr:MBL fold metallo-hydrolase [Catenovulum sp. 2E275]MCU4677236.1 MBL fold metallo-hydrolase [Catenovulum sp. 2E275]
MIFSVLSTLSSMSVLSQNMKSDDYAKQGLLLAQDFPGLASLCDLSKPLRDMGAKRERSSRQQDDQTRTQRDTSKQQSRPKLGPVKVFDNLYYVGTAGVASWVVKTSEGLVVIDALNNDRQAKEYIESGIEQLGLNPKDIKYLIISHGHGDHYGGQNYLVKNYQPRVVMSEIEWTILEQPEQDFSSPNWGSKPTRDISIKDGDAITLGDTTIQLYITPGHTQGTLSVIFPVYDQGEKHIASMWGGTGLNYGPKLERILAYSNSAKRFKQIAEVQNVDIFLSNHPKLDGTNEKIKALLSRKNQEPHPFVIGKKSVGKGYDLLKNCTYAQALKIQEQSQSF